MPLFLDDEQVTPKDFAYLHNLKDEKYKGLLKKPVFKLDDGQVTKKTTIKTNKNLSEPPTQGVKCSFWFEDADGLTKKLVYAESRAPKIEAGVRTWVYKPPYLFIKGTVANFLKKEEDKAVYMYFRPDNPMSPFAGKTKMFSFVDSVAETLRRSENMSDIQKALTHATTVDEEELIILAKGLKLLLSDDYDLTDLRLKMQEFAIAPTTNKAYVLAMTDQMIRVEGRIRNLVDKGFVKLEKQGSGRQWVGAKGWKEGHYIGDLIHNVNADALQHLMTAIKTEPDIYLWDLQNSTVLIQAERRMKEALEKEKVVVPAHLAEINMTDTGGNAATPSLKDEIYDVKSSQDFVTKRGYKKTSPELKQLRDAVAEGKVTNANVEVFLANLFNK